MSNGGLLCVMEPTFANVRSLLLNGPRGEVSEVPLMAQLVSQHRRISDRLAELEASSIPVR